MKYYRVLALIALIGSIMLAACGGEGKGFSLAGLSAITPENNPNVTVKGVQGLKPQLHFTYSLAGHPSASGFTVVALADEYTPKAASDAPYILAVKPVSDPAKPELVLNAGGQRIVLAHFRYDPTKWEIGGVSSGNCWPGASDTLGQPYRGPYSSTTPRYSSALCL